jgi:hypothetical protein
MNAYMVYLETLKHEISVTSAQRRAVGLGGGLSVAKAVGDRDPAVAARDEARKRARFLAQRYHLR